MLLRRNRRPSNGLFLPHGLLVNSMIHDQHDDDRSPKGQCRRDESVRLVHAEDALVGVGLPPLLVVTGRVPAEEDGKERDQGRGGPRDPDHDRGHTNSHVTRVFERAHDGVIPVHADAAQVKRGHRREVDVERVPQVTYPIPEVPLARDFHGGVEGHGEAGHEQVGHGQRHQEVVIDMPQLVVPDDADDHEQVGKDGQDNDEDEDGRLEYLRDQVVAPSPAVVVLPVGPVARPVPVEKHLVLDGMISVNPDPSVGDWGHQRRVYIIVVVEAEVLIVLNIVFEVHTAFLSQVESFFLFFLFTILFLSSSSSSPPS